MKHMKQTKLNKSDFLQVVENQSKSSDVVVVAMKYGIYLVPETLKAEVEYYYEAEPAELWDMVVELTALSDRISIR